MKPRVLIVDDDEKNLILLSVKMEREGYEIAKAYNGLQALDKLSTFRPDLILMDVMMPKMDGYEALRRIKSMEETRYIPVIMLTGRTEVEDKVLGFEVGAEDYISKPYSLMEVAARVKSLLRMRALQTKLRETEKMAALGEMVDGIAHEVRNPLTAIGGMARRLYEHEDDVQHKTYAENIMKAVARLERMLQRIDEYKRILVSKLSPGDINQVVQATVEEVRDLVRTKDIVINTSLMPGAPPVDMDYGNLKTAVFNVMQNSVEAISEKGEIKVETLPSLDNTLLLRITDNGCGMSEEEVRKIYNPFQTSKMEGAGMGLTITYRILHDHGADIEFHSIKGEGTVVTIKFHPSQSAEEAPRRQEVPG